MTENNENINSSEDKLIKKHWYKKPSNIIILSIIILLLIFNYNFTFVIVNGESMEPNYTDGNFLLAERQYKYLSRFDVVVVNSKAANKVLIKRIIGLPGDDIEYKDNQLFVNIEYCIVDDDKDMLDKQMKNFVHIDNYKGITDNDIENIKQILNIVQDN